ncbi:MAG: tetratricopeptide repeat protein [Bryobacteraceae bacterium]
MRLAAILFVSTLQAADWISLRSPDVELFSDASERTARQALDHLGQLRELLGSAQPEPIPLRIVLFAKASEYRAYAPDATVAGFYQTGFDRDYILTSTGSGLARVVAHEYVHFLTNPRTTSRPTWLEEGLAEFYSTFDGKRVGAPIPEHLQLLQRSTWLTADEINAPRELTPTFYAQSWALVHMLRREARFPERITTQNVTDLRQYIRNARPSSVTISAVATPAAVAEPVSPLNALLLRADLALHSQHPQLAHTLYEQAAKEYPNSSGAATGLATLAFAEGNRDGALKQLRHALDLNDRDALAWFELGAMENDNAALENAARWNPNLGEAHVLLGVRATDAGDLAAALRHLEQATNLMPRKSYAWYSLGYAQEKAGLHDAAELSLRTALRAATTTEQRQMAQTLLDSIEE